MPYSVTLWAACVGMGLVSLADPYDLGKNRFLFLDEFLLDKVDGATLTVNPPRQTELVMIADKPWERGGITSYGTVLYDPQREEYRLYYVPIAWEVPPGFGFALAISHDGVHWEKPNLGVVEWKGTKENNLVIWAQREGTAFIDPNGPAGPRYAMISSHPELRTRLFTSPDGILWSIEDKLISPLHSDSQISTFWDPDERLYFHYPRIGKDGMRAVGMVTTRTLDETWPETIEVVMAADERDPPGLDLYTNACQKYGLARDAYLGFPTPYYHYNEPGRTYLNEPTLAKGGKTNDGTIETQLATSRDGLRWTRYRTPYIALDNYEGLEIKIAMVIPGIVFKQDRLYQYFCGYTFTHGDTQVRYGEGGRDLGGVFRVEQRTDGFISLDFSYEGGEAATQPFTFRGNRLVLNLNTSASGEARAAILDELGNEVPGHGLADARIINGNYLAKTAEWKDGKTDVSALAGQPIRLRFVCRGTKLYSFRFE